MSFQSMEREYSQDQNFLNQFAQLDHNVATNSWVYMGQIQKPDGHIVYVYHNFITGERQERNY